MIQIAVMTFMYRGLIKAGTLSHADLVALCADSGAKGLEAFHADFLEEPELLPLYKTLLAEHGMSMPVVDVIVNLVYGNAQQKQESIDGLRRALDVCAELGTEIAHVAGQRPVDGVSLDDARNMIADTLAEHVDVAAARGLTLAFENFDPSPTLICSAKDCLQILERAGEGVKFVLDTGNFMAVGERADENFDAFYPHLCHCHFKDYGPNADGTGRRGWPLGQGACPDEAVAAGLLARGYDGWVALESLSGDPPTQGIPADMATLRSWLKL